MSTSTRHAHGACLVLLLCFGLAESAHAKPKQARSPTPTSTADDKPVEAEAAAEPPAADAPATNDAAPAATEPATPPPSTAEPVAPSSAASAAAASEAATAAAPAKPSARSPEKVAELRANVTTLMDDLATARAKAAVLGKALFKTRMVVRVQNLAGPDPVLGRLLVQLDGAPVFRGDGSALSGDEPRQVFESFVAPGPHVLTVEVEQRARSDEAYGYTLRESYRLSAPREKVTDLLLVLDDDSDLADDFADDGEGEYDVRTRLRQTTHEPKGR